MQRPTPHAQVRQRGSALLMVLILVAVSAVMCWAMLSESTIRVKAAKTSSAAMQASEHNEDAMKLALHYLAHPGESNEGTVDGPDGPYWPGGTYNLNGTDVTIDVTPEGGNVYAIQATSAHNGVTRTQSKRLQFSTVWRPSHALQARDEARLPHDWIITGGIKTDGDLVLTGSGPTYTDPVVATNHAEYPNGSAPGSNAPDETAPDSHDVNLLTTNTYEHEGNTYDIEYFNDDIENTTLEPTATNPLGVFRIRNGRTLKDVTVNGTMLCHDHIYIDGDVTIMPAEGMPALMTRKRLRFEPNSRLGVRGLVYVAEYLHGDDSARVKITGALLVANPRGGGLNDRWDGELEVIYDADAATVYDFSDVVTTWAEFEEID